MLPVDEPVTTWDLPPTLTGFEEGLPPLDLPLPTDDPVFDPDNPIFGELPPEVLPPSPPPGPPLGPQPPWEPPPVLPPPLPPGYPGTGGGPWEEGDLEILGDLFLEHTGKDLIDDIFEEHTGGDLEDFTDIYKDKLEDLADSIGTPGLIGLGVVGVIGLHEYGPDIVGTISDELLDPLGIELDPGDDVRIPIPPYDFEVDGIDVEITPVITITVPDDDHPDGITEFRLNFSLRF